MNHMSNFIYVTNIEARDTLLACGYNLLKSNEEKNIYVFENKSEQHFSLKQSEYVFSDTLTF